MLIITVPVITKEVNIKIRQQPLFEEREVLRFILNDQIPIFMSFFCGQAVSTSLYWQQGTASGVISIREMGTVQGWRLLSNSNTEQQHTWEEGTAQECTMTALRKTHAPPFQLSSSTIFIPSWKPVTHITVYKVPHNTERKKNTPPVQSILSQTTFLLVSQEPSQNIKWAKAKTMTVLLWLMYSLVRSHLSLQEVQENCLLASTTRTGLRQTFTPPSWSHYERLYNLSVGLFRLPLWKAIITHLPGTHYLTHSPHSHYFSYFVVEMPSMGISAVLYTCSGLNELLGRVVG